MKKSKNKIEKNEHILRLDFDTGSREFIEIYEISPDGSQVRTQDGWIPSYKEGVITQRPLHETGFVTSQQVEAAIRSEKELLKEKKFKETAGYRAAKLYPIKEWLEEKV